MASNFDFEEMLAIAEECSIRTKPIHAKSNKTTQRRFKFFKPKLKSVNHLNDHGSELINHPLSHTVEFLYKVWERIRNFFQAIHRKLHPRKETIIGSREDGFLVGHIAFATREDQYVPIHHMHCEIWARTRLGAWLKLGEGDSDANGNFRIGFDMSVLHRNRMRKKVHFEFYQAEQHTFDKYRAINQDDLFHTLFIKKDCLTGMEYNLGTINLFYWEKREDTIIPRVAIKDHDEDAPQKYPQGRIDAISEQFIPIEIITKELLAQIKLKKSLTIEQIQEHYPENLTVEMERMKPGITRSDEWFGERMMNGMYASTFDRDPNDPNLLWLYYHWSSYDHTDQYAFNDISMKFRLNNDGYLLPKSITLKGPTHKGEKNTGQTITLTPEDGPRWESAKRVARVSGGILTEIDKHFVETHLNTEQYALAAYRNIRNNPVGALLFPHLRGVVLINHTADQILVKEGGYIDRATALTPKGTNKRVLDVMGTLDWKNWKPMKPLSSKHTYALAANLFYDILTEYIDEFVEAHLAEIIDEWHEIYLFSEDIVSHSVPAFLCKHLQKALKANPSAGEKSDGTDWYSGTNRMDLAIDRPMIDGEYKAVSVISKTNDYDISQPETFQDDLNRLKQACAYIIFNATFGHYWANSKQYDDIGEIRYSSLGIRFGDGPDGVLGPESDDSIAPDLKISAQMMWWSNMLSRTGYIMTNEEKDINPLLIEKLKAKEKEFIDLGVDIYDIQSRTNI